MKSVMKLAILALISAAASSASAHELRGHKVKVDDTADFSPKEELIAEGRGHWDDSWNDYGRGYDNYGRHHRRDRDYYDDEWNPRWRTNHGQPAWKRRANGDWKPTASLKRQRNRLQRQDRQWDRRNCRHCSEQESALLSDFYDKFNEDEADFIAGFLND